MNITFQLKPCSWYTPGALIEAPLSLPQSSFMWKLQPSLHNVEGTEFLSPSTPSSLRSRESRPLPRGCLGTCSLAPIDGVTRTCLWPTASWPQVTQHWQVHSSQRLSWHHSPMNGARMNSFLSFSTCFRYLSLPSHPVFQQHLSPSTSASPGFIPTHLAGGQWTVWPLPSTCYSPAPRHPTLFRSRQHILYSKTSLNQGEPRNSPTYISNFSLWWREYLKPGKKEQMLLSEKLAYHWNKIKLAPDFITIQK